LAATEELKRERLDNLTRGKFSKHWRILQQNYKKKNTKVRKLEEMQTECKRTTEIPTDKKKETKRKADVFQ